MLRGYLHENYENTLCEFFTFMDAPKHFAFAMPSTKIKDTYKKTHML